MTLREETATDIDAISELTYQAFENHPHHEPGAKPTEHLIVKRLRNNGALTLSLVAEAQGAIVGHIAFSPVSINGQAGHWFGLGPVSVLPSHQRQGIGSQLIRQGLKTLTAQGAEGFVLLGDPQYYGRFGFRAQPGLVLPGVPAEYFVVLPVAQDSPLPEGQVAYHSAFE